MIISNYIFVESSENIFLKDKTKILIKRVRNIKKRMKLFQ